MSIIHSGSWVTGMACSLLQEFTPSSQPSACSRHLRLSSATGSNTNSPGAPVSPITHLLQPSLPRVLWHKAQSACYFRQPGVSKGVCPPFSSEPFFLLTCDHACRHLSLLLHLTYPSLASTLRAQAVGGLTLATCFLHEGPHPRRWDPSSLAPW